MLCMAGHVEVSLPVIRIARMLTSSLQISKPPSEVIGRARHYESMEGGTGHCVIRVRDGALFTWGGPAFELPAAEWRDCTAAQREAMRQAKPCAAPR